MALKPSLCFPCLISLPSLVTPHSPLSGAASPESKPPAFYQGEAGGGWDAWWHRVREKVFRALKTSNACIFRHITAFGGTCSLSFLRRLGGIRWHASRYPPAPQLAFLPLILVLTWDFSGLLNHYYQIIYQGSKILELWSVLFSSLVLSLFFWVDVSFTSFTVIQVEFSEIRTEK